MKEYIYRIHYNWFFFEKGEFYYDFTVGREGRIIENEIEKYMVKKIEIKGSLLEKNAIATIYFENGIKIEQANISTIITVPEDYEREPKPEEKKTS